MRPCMCANGYSTMCCGHFLCVRWCGSVSDRRCRDQWIADNRFHISYPGLRVARRIRQKVAANSIYLTRWLIICQFVPAAWAISARHREFALIKSIALAGNVLSFSPEADCDCVKIPIRQVVTAGRGLTRGHRNLIVSIYHDPVVMFDARRRARYPQIIPCSITGRVTIFIDVITRK